jgi:hypothetical protein
MILWNKSASIDALKRATLDYATLRDRRELKS